MLNEGFDVFIIDEIIRNFFREREEFFRYVMREKEEVFKILLGLRNGDDKENDIKIIDYGMIIMFGNMVVVKFVDRVICDICNKDLCNKYFFKVYKFKVYGIEFFILDNKFDFSCIVKY